jgi:protein O-mannosyl-transferase
MLEGRRAYLWLALAAVALYARSLWFDWVYLDDNALILDQFRFLGDWGSVLEAFKRDVFHIPNQTTSYYRPLFMVSLIFDAHWSGLSPAGYHATSLLIHWAGCCLVLKFLEALGFERKVAFFGALLFTVSPALGQAVALVPDRDDPILAVFCLASFLGFVEWRRGGGAKPLAAHHAFYLLALFSKESAVILPVCCLLHALFVEKRAWPARSLWTLAAPWGAATLLWYTARAHALSSPLPMTAAGSLRSILECWEAFPQYLGKLILPFNLSVLPAMSDTEPGWGAAAFGLLVVALSSKQGRKPLQWWGLAWFALFLLPSLTLKDTTFGGVMMEKRAYLPAMGLLVALLDAGLGAWALARPRAAALLVAGYAAICALNLAHYRDRLSFWTNAVRTSPSLHLAHLNLGSMYFFDERFDDAAREFTAAIKANPAGGLSHNNLGLVYMRQGRLKEAEAEFRQELSLFPRCDHALFNLGLLFYRTDRLREADALWRRTLEANPAYLDAYANLAVLAQKRGDPGQAAAWLEQRRRAQAR